MGFICFGQPHMEGPGLGQVHAATLLFLSLTQLCVCV